MDITELWCAMVRQELERRTLWLEAKLCSSTEELYPERLISCLQQQPKSLIRQSLSESVTRRFTMSKSETCFQLRVVQLTTIYKFQMIREVGVSFVVYLSMCVTAKKMHLTAYSKENLTAPQGLPNWTRHRPERIQSSLCMLRVVLELSRLIRWSTQSYTWSTWQDAKEPRNPAARPFAFKKLKLSTSPLVSWSRLYSHWVTREGNTFPTDKPSSPIFWEIPSVATAWQLWLPTSGQKLDTSKKCHQLWNSRQEWWKWQMRPLSTFCRILLYKSDATRKKSEIWSKSWQCMIPCLTEVESTMRPTTRKSKLRFKNWRLSSSTERLMILATLILSERSVKSFLVSGISTGRLSRILRRSRDRSRQIRRLSRSSRNKSRRKLKKLLPKRLLRLKRLNRRNLMLRQLKKRSMKRRRRKKSLRSRQSANLLTSSRHSLSLKKVPKVKNLRRGSVGNVKVPKSLEQQWRLSQIQLTKIKVRSTHSKSALTGKKKKGKSDFATSNCSRTRCSKKRLRKSSTKRNSWCSARWRIWRRRIGTTSTP